MKKQQHIRTHHLTQRRLPLFVYGTLIPGQSNYPHYLAGKTLTEERAYITNAQLYTDGRYPYLVVDPAITSTQDVIYGMLITVQQRLYQRVLQHIDTLERYRPHAPDNWYERIVCRAHCASAARPIVDAWVYVAAQRVNSDLRRGIYQRVAHCAWVPTLCADTT